MVDLYVYVLFNCIYVSVLSKVQMGFSLFDSKFGV